uniref:Xylulose kinase-1 n=1 Tax=Tanacetum cinerariifolium TaxID=118510 RepID=A0A699IX42_TANCI|nr:hypothetical protein [Tanacetum cinerariifolium]
MSTPKFAETHNLVVFLEKPTEFEGFKQIINFLNANPIKYALTVNPTIYTSCIKQFWAMTKVKTVDGEEQIQALVDKKKVIITKTSVRSDLHLKDAKVFLDSQVEGMLKPKEIYVTPSHTKNIFANIKRLGKDFSDEHVTTTSNDPLLSGEDRLKLTELMKNYTQLQLRVFALETTKANQALEIGSLKRKMKKLEKKANKKTYTLKRLYKICSSTRVESSDDVGLGDQEDASKQGRIIDNLDADAEVTLVDETKGMNDQDMFDTSILDDEEVVAKNEKDQIMFDEEVARNLQAQLQTELEEEKRLARKKGRRSQIALIAEWDDVQAMMDADHELAERLQVEDFEEVQKAFDNTMSWINSFVPMEKDRAKGNEQIEAKVDDDQEEAQMKMYMKIILDDEIPIDVIPVATKPPIIVDWKIIKEGKISSYHLIRADRSSKKYSSMIQMLQHIDKEDLKTLWKLVKANYGNTRPEEGYEKVL